MKIFEYFSHIGHFFPWIFQQFRVIRSKTDEIRLTWLTTFIGRRVNLKPHRALSIGWSYPPTNRNAMCTKYTPTILTNRKATYCLPVEQHRTSVAPASLFLISISNLNVFSIFALKSSYSRIAASISTRVFSHWKKKLEKGSVGKS